MVTYSGSRHFRQRTLASIGGVFILFALCFVWYQYQRERAFKTDILHSRLQALNYAMEQQLGEKGLRSDTAGLRTFVAGQRIEGLRVTVVDTKGRVLQDTRDSTVENMENHLLRTEIANAIEHGDGYDIKRASASTGGTYFYSATRFGDLIVRSAVPYSAELTRSLRANYSFVWYALAIVLLLGLVLYCTVRRIGSHVELLREFAVRAERGEPLDHELERALPDDELGDISHTVMVLYWQLRHSEEDKTRLKRQLTQNAAHELKTPAASIHGYLEAILSDPDMPAEQRQHFLERCYAQSERMSRLLLDMATLTRLDGPQPVEKTLVDIREMILGIIDESKPDFERLSITPSLYLPDIIHISGDRGLLYSIFRNIVDNALAYATGATRLTIICAEVDNGDSHIGYEFTISDNGPGVPLQHLSHIFERFYRVDKGRSRRLGGTGLGLAIVKNAVLAHGGTVSAEPTPGGGLTIRFQLVTEA